MRALAGRLDILTGALMALVIGWRLLIPPIVGLADNGDYERLMERVGLRHVLVPSDDPEFMRSLYARLTPARLIWFVTAHPQRLWALLNRSAGRC